MNKNEIFLRIIICNFDDISHDEISALIGQQPTNIHIKGQRINPKWRRIANKNAWMLNSGHDKYTPFNIQLDCLLNLIESKYDVFKILTSKYYCELACALYVYRDNEESTPSLHLTERYHKVTTGLTIEFDLDLYCL